MSTTCTRVRALLGAHHDGELDAVRDIAVDRHVAACAACRAELGALERLSRAAVELRAEEPPADLGARVRAAAERERVRAEGAPWARRVAAAAALVLVTATAYAIGLWHGGLGLGGLEQGGPGRDGSRGPGDSPRTESGGLVNAGPLSSTPALADATLPDDAAALRAARSLFADLALVDRVPASVRVPLLEAQLAHFGLDRWARERDGAGPMGEVASLVRRLDEAVDHGAPRAELAVLRDSAARPGLWRVPPAEDPGAPGTATDEVEQLVDRLGAGLDGETRRSIGRWVSAKDAWVRRGDDLDTLVQMVDALGLQLGHELGAGHAFVLPDLAELEAGLEWTVEPDGTRRGVLHRESSGPGESGVLHIEVREQRTRSGGR